jgi:hypothetical protein
MIWGFLGLEKLENQISCAPPLPPPPLIKCLCFPKNIPIILRGKMIYNVVFIESPQRKSPKEFIEN